MKYKVGDRVRIKSLDWYNENKDKNGNIVFLSKVPHFALCVNVRTMFTKDMVKYCGKVVTIENVWTANYSIVEGTHRDYFTDEMIEGLVEEEIIDIDDFQDDNEIIDVIDEYVHRLKNNECQINLPEGYQFTDENGNVINTNKIVLEKKKEYPITIEECCKILGLEFNPFYTGVRRQVNYKDGLLHNLKCLLIYRDAYWKIAGEEMGLGKPWEPTMETVYCISRNDNVIKCSYRGGKSNILEFPTAEMRDAFYENFKEEIESCKELL